ncbi:hypothetical protein VFPPC_17525 [Pochonia chlamydosporia 170]|uniref:Uncharacterized protein n=1 Tax=Pochonia chlamydosporia 170 TaxID=1380566 RepID=A0A219ARR5_METCM|nr:hypothetical protein VFPPC_17525 [Pochonia chlamydosporia 170]OWT43312.1 hypothetical protein VFPPC_17525 [Pochonia chlamydosporia 170]
MNSNVDDSLWKCEAAHQSSSSQDTHGDLHVVSQHAIGHSQTNNIRVMRVADANRADTANKGPGLTKGNTKSRCKQSCFYEYRQGHPIQMMKTFRVGTNCLQACDFRQGPAACCRI